MDTRSKIVTPAEARLLLQQSAKRIAVVAGLFDPLTLQTAELFNNFAGKMPVLAIVLESPDALLPAPVRATLVAALRTVATVVVAAQDSWQSLLPPTFSGTIHFDPPGDSQRSRDFVNLVRRKQGAH